MMALSEAAGLAGCSRIEWTADTENPRHSPFTLLRMLSVERGRSSTGWNITNAEAPPRATCAPAGSRVRPGSSAPLLRHGGGAAKQSPTVLVGVVLTTAAPATDNGLRTESEVSGG